MPRRALSLSYLCLGLSLWFGASLVATANQSCPSEQLYSAAQIPSFATNTRFDDSCFVISPQINNQTLIVDIRREADFENLHLLNSVNMPGESMLQKGYLKNQEVIVVGAPYARQQLGQLCHRLKTNGFDRARIVIGGVLAVSEKRNMNLPASDEAMNFVAPRQFAIELLADQSRLVFLNKNAATKTGLDGLRNTMTLDLEQVSHARDALVEVAGNIRYPVFVVGNEEEYRQVRSWFSSRRIDNVYFVKGGVQGFQEFVKENRRIQIAMRSVPNRYKCS